MADYDSDSSGADDVATNVLLGYASKEPTVDAFSQLGGHPVWLDGKTAPSGALAKCLICNGLMSLLLQLHGDIPDRFPGHERALYMWACRRKACRRKEGSIRGFRAIRIDSTRATSAPTPNKQVTAGASNSGDTAKPTTNLGETLFGVKSPTNTTANPFSTQSANGSASSSNPFASSSAAQTPAAVDSLPETFAQKARISSPRPTEQIVSSPTSSEPWPEASAFPEPYHSYHVDADCEYLESDPKAVPSNARLDNGEGSSTGPDDKALFESSMDKTFQRFADRLAQNPEQVLRYEFAGQPLLYAKNDAVGKKLAPGMEDAKAKVQVSSQGGSNGLSARLPRCTNCGSPRVFELQLTPHAITELEADEMSVDGMDWGTIILAVCGTDCQQQGKDASDIGYVEEWIGVQWEELTERKRP